MPCPSECDLGQLVTDHYQFHVKLASRTIGAKPRSLMHMALAALSRREKARSCRDPLGLVYGKDDAFVLVPTALPNPGNELGALKTFSEDEAQSADFDSLALSLYMLVKGIDTFD